MQNIAKAALIICMTYLAVHTGTMEWLWIIGLVLFDWD